MLLLNTYFPCDPRVNNFDETELLTLLAEMKQIMRKENCVYNLVLGDLNCHFSRRTTFTSLVENFFSDLNFKIFWEVENLEEELNIQEIQYTYSQCSNNQLIKSTIDHFVANETLLKTVVEAGAIHSGENPSNHSPIFVKFKLGGIDPHTEKSSPCKRVNWGKSYEQAKNKYSS